MHKNNYRKLFDLQGKNALVTGGAGILGSVFCSALADFGANVAVVDIDKKSCSRTADFIKKNFNVKTLAIACDVSNPSAVRKMAEQLEDKWGKIHVLHNNAATKGASLKDFFQPFTDYSLRTWREVMSVNIDSYFLVAKEISNLMIEKKIPGSIIQTASIYGVLGPDARIYDGSWYLNMPINSPAVYSASKGAVVAFTKYLATSLASHGIRVNTLTPGGVESGQNKEFIQKYSNRVPLQRMAKKEELAGALVYLASDASSYVTGHNLIVDGGIHAW